MHNPNYNEEEVIILRSKTAKQKEKEQRKGGTGGINKEVKNLDSDDPSMAQGVDKDLKKMLIQARTAKKLSQQQLATSSSVAIDIIKQIEQGKGNKPPHNIVIKLEKTLGVKLKG